jgi:aerobic carbon-monoxide dehydrogenase medium subunit
VRPFEFQAPTSVEELRTVEQRDGGLRLGSMVSYRTAVTDQRIADRLPLVAAAAGSVGSVHIRNLGTIGGSLCHADPAGDVPTVGWRSAARTPPA